MFSRLTVEIFLVRKMLMRRIIIYSDTLMLFNTLQSVQHYMRFYNEAQVSTLTIGGGGILGQELIVGGGDSVYSKKISVNYN